MPDEHRPHKTHSHDSHLPGELPLVAPGLGLLAVSVGNTNTRFVTYHAGHAHEGMSLPNADMVQLVDALSHAAAHVGHEPRSAVVIASTNHRFRDELVQTVKPRLKSELYLIGSDLEIPVEHALSADSAARTGQDRLLNALAAFDLLKSACVIVSAGTACTVDFVDGEGVFQGGAILPGARMWLRAMHDGTTALPIVEPRRPADGTFGKSTEQAMLNGIFHGMRGAVRALVERYAEAYEAYPRVVATGGDAPFLFSDDELIERIEPDLTLRGIALTCRAALADQE